VTDYYNADESRLLNYLTAPNVLVWSAVVASCAIPGMFKSVDLWMLTESGQAVPYNPRSTGFRFQDGSVGSDLPMKRLSELFNINTFIVSQVNPHIVPFVSVGSGDVIDSMLSKRYIRTMKALIGNEIRHWLKQLNTIGLLPENLRWVANLVVQSHKGHVTIVPSPTLQDYRNLLNNVTPELYWPSFQHNYVNTLTKISQIRSYFGVEREFDRYYTRLKAQVRGSARISNFLDHD
jgi:predicted acylesterase/phospholipase RssA